MPARGGRTQSCTSGDARIRARQARAFLETASLIVDVDDELATPGVAATLAVLSGIAASDALCCQNLGRRARGQDHREATGLLAQVEPDGPALAKLLARLLEIKDNAQYGTVYLQPARARTAIRHAARLTEAAEVSLRR
jgi:hypothetical protein